MIQTWTGEITLLSPLAHNSDENAGTDTKFRRIKMQGENGVNLIPVYSGNAFRGKLRRLAALDFLSRIGITQDGEEKISDKLYYMMFCGGSLAKGSTGGGKLDIGLKRAIREKIPFLSLFGTAVSNQMIQGKLSVGMGVPRCSEVDPIEPKSCWDLVEEIFYTRRDDLEDRERSEKDQAQQMKYTVECLSTGSILKHEFLLRHPTEIEAACFGAVMLRFIEDGNLGGKSGIGHGRVALDYTPEWPVPTAYYEHIRENRDEISDYMRGTEKVL